MPFTTFFIDGRYNWRRKTIWGIKNSKFTFWRMFAVFANSNLCKFCQIKSVSGKIKNLNIKYKYQIHFVSIIFCENIGNIMICIFVISRISKIKFARFDEASQLLRWKIFVQMSKCINKYKETCQNYNLYVFF